MLSSSSIMALETAISPEEPFASPLPKPSEGGEDGAVVGRREALPKETPSVAGVIGVDGITSIASSFGRNKASNYMSSKAGQR